MAVLAPQDWHPPRDLSMDAPPNAISSSVPRQRSSPANDHSTTTSQISPQPYPYPVQQQQAGWTPPHPQQQYYPSFYQNHHQQPYQLHAHPGQGQMHAQSPYYDPANAQFAQWAYQQMVYNAHHAHQLSHVPSPQHSGQRTRAGSASTSDYFVPPQMAAAYSPFPSGTPPAHPSQLPNMYPSAQSDHSAHQSQYNGYHPYRRPNRQGSQHQDTQQTPPNNDWRAGPFQPPYARSDAAGSSTSVNSASSHSGSSRHRTNSLQGSSAPPGSGKAPATNGSSRGSGGTTPSSSASSTRPHQRTTSSSSNGSASTPRQPVPSSASSSASHVAAASRKPSPLSQGNFTATEKRMSRDDSDLAAMLEPTPGVRSGGLKGRLRRALSLNAGSTLREEDEDDTPIKGSSSRRPPALNASGSSHSIAQGDDESTATVQKKKSKSLFNSRLNRSTDNISLSSTMSSASMVIRKLGNIGKLTRRNSLAGITSLFKDKDKKDKDKDEGEDGGKKGKKKKDGKATVSEPSVSHATAELDPSEWSADLTGLSPAARLARQHTLKTNAEAAARAKSEQEAKAAAAAQAQASTPNNVPTAWEKNTTTRQGENSGGRGLAKINEDGMRVIVEDDSDSDEGHDAHVLYNQSMEGWEEDDDEWGEAQDEEVTIRHAFEAAALHDDDDMEPWAINVRRSEERTRKPTKGILKMRPDGTAYDQADYAQRTNASFGRTRSNSFDSSPSHGPELGPLARIPSPDPDHIDGLHKHPHSPNSISHLPPLSFESKSPLSDTPKDPDSATVRAPTPDRSLFSHPNSSAPALSTMYSANPPTLTQRSATSPAKRLAFATNLSVYDTFPATVYDRRSEPATWSRLTPALAQRIKEELNSYKMEEMEVHAASRIHTQFFV